jgi:hypothetical protein
MAARRTTSADDRRQLSNEYRSSRCGQQNAPVPHESPGFDSPQQAALASWASAPSAHPRVVSVDVRGDRAEVVIDTDPSYPDWVYCVRRNGQWSVAIAGNAPCHRWDDPEFIHWR